MKRLPAALADEFDTPAGPTYTLHGQRRRRHAADLPARDRGRGLAQRVDAALSPLPKHQGQGSAFLGRQLQAPCGGHGDSAYFPNYGGKPTMFQPFLHGGKNILIPPAFRLNKPLRHQPGLSKTGREQVAPVHRPKNLSLNHCPRDDTGNEQDSGSIVAQPRGAGCNFMEGATGKPSCREAAVHGLCTKAKAWPALALGERFNSLHFLSQGEEP